MKRRIKMGQPSLKDILLEDAKDAKTNSYENVVLPAGEYIGKVLNFTEEDTYQYIAMEVDGVRHNFFYNYYLYETTDLDGNVIAWIKELATFTTNEKTSLLDIANSAIGCSYKFTIYNYVPKSGKNRGVTQHAISFKDLPSQVSVTIDVEEEDLDLPY